MPPVYMPNIYGNCIGLFMHLTYSVLYRFISLQQYIACYQFHLYSQHHWLIWTIPWPVATSWNSHAGGISFTLPIALSSLSLLPSPQLFSLHWSQIALYPNHLTSLSFIHLCLLLSTSYNPILLSLFHAVSSRPSPCPLHTCTDPLHHLNYYPFLAPSHFEGHK